MPTDGYYLLTSILKMPNLRSDAFELLNSILLRGDTRIRLPVLIYLIVLDFTHKSSEGVQ
jgi:hypothetical protein